MIKKIIKNPFLWAFFIGIGSLHLIKEMALRRRHAPEPMVHVPDWSLINHDAKEFGKKDLAGKVVIANFFFTSCPSLCPKLTEAMKEVFVRLNKDSSDFAFMSISVDPKADTPEVLQEFRRKNDLMHDNWHFLTGNEKDVYKVVVENMRVHMGEREAVPSAPGVYDIPHLAHLALFDQNGDLRGLFKAESVELAALVRAAKFLVEKGG
jgi:protein SCO1/2